MVGSLVELSRGAFRIVRRFLFWTDSSVSPVRARDRRSSGLTGIGD